jgi:TIR domain/CHAT domain
MDKIRILFLEANPFTTNQPGLEEKVRTIRQELQCFRNLVFDLGWAASIDDLKGELEFYPSDVVHFIGHGTGEGIVLSRKAGDVKAISDEALALRFSRFSPRTRLVILDGCYTSEQAKALTDVVDCVIGINNRVDANTILWFTMVLYGHISQGYSFQEAVEQSKVAVPSIGFDLLGKKPTVVLLPSDARSQSTTDNRELASSLAMGIDLEQNIPTVWLSRTPSYIPFKRRKVFICYYKSLEDEKWLQRLQAHLAPLECEGISEPWGITKDPIDVESEQELQIAIETARVVILLVSAEFLASGSILNNQLPTLMLKAQSGGTAIIPLIIAPCSFKHSKLKDFPPFKSNSSLAKMSRTAAEETLVQLVDNLSEKV